MDYFPQFRTIKENEIADETTIQVVDMPRLPYTYYYLTIRRARNIEWQRELGNSTRKLNYVKPRIEKWESAHNRCRQYEVRLSRFCIGHIRLNHWYLMSRNDQQPTCTNATYRNQRLIIKYCFQKCPQWRDNRKNI